MLPSRRFLAAGTLCLLLPGAAMGATRRGTTLSDLVSGASRIFRGVCEKVETGSVVVGGARIRMTAYTFRVSERLKGNGGATITFRQVGAPEGGPTDLGRLAGLPVYAAGRDYLLLLLPESRAGLTSPAGAAQGAFEIVGDRAVPLRAMPGEPQVHAYGLLRRQILHESRR